MAKESKKSIKKLLKKINKKIEDVNFQLFMSAALNAEHSEEFQKLVDSGWVEESRHRC